MKHGELVNLERGLDPREALLLVQKGIVSVIQEKKLQLRERDVLAYLCAPTESKGARDFFDSAVEANMLERMFPSYQVFVRHNPRDDDPNSPRRHFDEAVEMCLNACEDDGHPDVLGQMDLSILRGSFLIQIADSSRDAIPARMRHAIISHIGDFLKRGGIAVPNRFLVGSMQNTRTVLDYMTPNGETITQQDKDEVRFLKEKILPLIASGEFWTYLEDILNVKMLGSRHEYTGIRGLSSIAFVDNFGEHRRYGRDFGYPNASDDGQN